MKSLAIAFIGLGSCLTLAGCGDSSPVHTPEAAPADGRTSATSAAEDAPVPHLALAPFAGALAGAATSDDCALDEVSSAQRAAYEVKRADTVEVAGWAADRKLDRAPQQAEFVFEAGSAFSVILPLNQPRPDVANVIGKPTFERVGYRALLDISQLVPGNYRIAIKYDGQAGPIVCRPGVTITVA